MRPFRIDVSPAELDDLRDRLARTRYTTPAPRYAGVAPQRLRGIVEYWRDRFDWRAQEARLNAYPQFIAEVGGQDVHFVHRRSSVPGAPAIVLTHGWPYTFAEMLPLADELAEFDVVVPSLPGYAWSALPAEASVVGPTVAETWNELMTSVLGYERFLTYGEDVGGGVSDWLAALHPESVAGIHAAHPAFTPAERQEGQSAAEAAFFEWVTAKWKRASAYSAAQSTRPDTLAAGLSDSPAGLAAWIVEKLEEWSDGDDVFTLDQMLTTVSLYWHTNSIGSSFRSYFDHPAEPSLPVIAVPAGVTVQRHESEYPREMAERNYADLRFFSKLDRGGHFTASEAPAALAADIRAFVGMLS